MKTAIIAILLFTCVELTQSQTLLGTTGWLNIPTAEMQEDGTFFAGGSFINKNYIANYGSSEYNLATYYFNLTFLPFLEINFGNMRVMDNIENNGTVDRRFSFRFRPLRERKYIPAVVIGAHDIYTSVGKENGNQYFSSLYIVLTKHFALNKSEFAATLGYGIDAFKNNRYIGFFGGVSFSPGFYRPLSFIVNYDAKEFNVGATVLFFNHLAIDAVLTDFQYFSAGIAYKVYLLNNFKKKIKPKKTTTH